MINNVTSATLACLPGLLVPPDHLQLDPESNANVSVVFNAPAAGTYTIRGDFVGIDTTRTSHGVQIFDDSTSIFDATIAAFGQSDPFGLTETLAVGDTIAFTNDTGSSFEFLSTGLAASIAPATSPPPSVPEPSTLALLAAGLCAWLFSGRSRRLESRA